MEYVWAWVRHFVNPLHDSQKRIAYENVAKQVGVPVERLQGVALAVAAGAPAFRLVAVSLPELKNLIRSQLQERW